MARSPMILQYLAVKEKHPDHILFFRLGDFYEMFFDDAKLASGVLDLVLTGRDCGDGERAPMCGVPYHACDAYIAKLIAKGYKVAICEQMEDPATAKGIVRREVIRIVTPGTVMSPDSLEEGKNNYIASVHSSEDGLGMCFADITTGTLCCLTDGSEKRVEKIINELGRFSPSEVILSAATKPIKEVTDFLDRRTGTVITYGTGDANIDSCIRIVEDHFHKNVLALGISAMPAVIIALGSLLDYLYETQMTAIANITDITFVSEDQYMLLDVSTRRNLELCETMRTGEKKGSLLHVLDRTKTPMGKRMLRGSLEKPLMKPEYIRMRLNAVEALLADSINLSSLRETMSGVRDIERLAARIAYRTAGAKELRALCLSLMPLPEIKATLGGFGDPMLQSLCECVDPLDDVCSDIDRTITDDPPVSVREGGFVRDGVDAELDELRGLLKNLRGVLASIEEREREATGIKNLKVKYNKVFGYYIDVTNMYKNLVPEHYIRKQTLVGGERYVTEELKELEVKISTADERINDIEYGIFTALIERVGQQLSRMQATASAVAMIDMLCSFAAVSSSNRYVKPEIVSEGVTEITDGRHPVVENMLPDGLFVPNDTKLDLDENMIAIITGPNMAGKSTYMRQVALITIMAQIGCFVPAAKAKIGIADKVFTRVGASDDLSMGQSTFMVEMSEVAYILKNATRQSLVIFDEIGRGTSTYDGMSIARAVIDYVADVTKCRTLFATHYHEITDLEAEMPCVKNYNITVKKRDKLVFLRKIVRGRADDSYGIEVADLAGVPAEVTDRARQILKSLEANGVERRTPAPVPQREAAGGKGAELLEKLRRVQADTLSPIEALKLLYELSAEAKEAEKE
ncbi:MAG: DNA mismatch repair protein MutS [Clostridia bacterium]|nr:DNA mismatch repair protein MutS [Clostridia bacterium]